MFFDFSSAFNTIRPSLLGEKLTAMQVEAPIVSWINDYLMDDFTSHLVFPRKKPRKNPDAFVDCHIFHTAFYIKKDGLCVSRGPDDQGCCTLCRQNSPVAEGKHFQARF